MVGRYVNVCEKCGLKLSPKLPAVSVYIYNVAFPSNADNKVYCITCFKKL